MTAAEKIHALHASLAINRRPEAVGRGGISRPHDLPRQPAPLFTEIFGPLVGLKEEWAAQGDRPDELDFSAFRYRTASEGSLPVNTGWMGGQPEEILSETDDLLEYRDRMGRHCACPGRRPRSPCRWTIPCGPWTIGGVSVRITSSPKRASAPTGNGLDTNCTPPTA